MKSILAAACVAAMMAASADVATVSNVNVTQDSSRRVIVSYSIDKPAVITLDIQTNVTGSVYASIGAENIKTLWGDVNRVVKEGNRTLYWAPNKDWEGRVFTEPNMVKAVVTAWDLDATPDYMAVDLTMPSNVWYYVAAECVPGGVTNVKYKTDWLLLRKIPAQGVTWRMGIAPADASQDSVAKRAVAHLVQLSADYYIGVYPVTQKQHSLMGGGYRTSALSGDNVGDMKPAGGLDWVYVRNGDWPDSPRHSSVSAVIAKFRKQTGVEFDLPTEAQWEFACRAGTGGCLYTGETWNDTNLDKIAWFSGNTTHLQDVGQKESNAYGLYDMIGNVWEMCLDYYKDNYIVGANGEPIVDPEGPEAWTASYAKWPHSMRGGTYSSTYDECASHRRSNNFAKDGYAPAINGYRLMAPMGGKW